MSIDYSTMVEAGAAEVIAEVAEGKLVGRRLADGTCQFLGVPYAADPVESKRRFRAPIDHAPWAGFRDATTHGPSAPQPEVDYWGRPNDDPRAAWGNGGNWYALFAPTYRPGGEFLTANISTPSVDSSKLPVIVFIHGGAYNLGNNSMPVYDGARMASLGVVFVAINYRLGAEGFWHVEGGQSNVGLRDQIHALKWVSRNIAAFGGDPENVTVMGQSAGAGSAGILSVSPQAHGLFRRSIALSSGIPGAMSRNDAEEDSRRLGHSVSVRPELASVAALSPMELVSRVHSSQLSPVRPCPHGRMDYSTIFVPKVDGEIVPDDYREVFVSGPDVPPMVTGITSDESAWRVYQTGAHETWGRRDLENYLATIVTDPSGAAKAFSDLHPEASPADLKARVMYYDMYLRNVRPTLERKADSNPGSLFCYLFDEKSTAADGKYGAFHLLDLIYSFDVLEDPSAISMAGGKGSAKVASDIRSAWSSFASAGDPGWMAYRPGEPTIRRFASSGDSFVSGYGDSGLLEYWCSIRK